LLLLQKAGYEPIWMVRMLKMVNEMLKKGENKTSPYFSTHPSVYERLSKIPSNEQELHQWISKMEYAFADIQLGKNLKTKSKRSGEYYVYAGKANSLALRVQKDIVTEIVVFR
jgi:predicted Zn-dependent protease